MTDTVRKARAPAPPKPQPPSRGIERETGVGEASTAVPEPEDSAAASVELLAEADRQKQAILDGDGALLLEHVMFWCFPPGERPAAMPEWLRHELFCRLGRYRNHTVATLDEAFGLKRPDGYRRESRRAEFTKGMSLYAGVVWLKAVGVGPESTLVAVVGRLLGIGETRAKELFSLYAKRNGRVNWPSMDRADLPGWLHPALDELLPVKSGKPPKRDF